MKKIPRFVIAGTHSGVGKTTMTLGIILALQKRGLQVQAFKTGPDYIDPGFHSLATGKPARNLDTVMMGVEGSLSSFLRNTEECDIAVVEGVMGLFDGDQSTPGEGSTAHLAKTLKAPVILCIDARAMAQSAGAVALGFKSFDQDLMVAGFILNNIASESHFLSASTIIEKVTSLPVLGYMQKDSKITMPERHLGLVPAWERRSLGECEEPLVKAVEDHIDVDRLIDIAEGAAEIKWADNNIIPDRIRKSENQTIKLGYALDKAFHFYYQDNLDILEALGAELVPFSPISDNALPDKCDGLYLGGGYPELHGRELEKNDSMRNTIREAAQTGMPVYGECGGLMYLMDKIVTFDGAEFEMAGVFQGYVKMEKKLAALGYRTGTVLKENPVAGKDWKLKGHVFHWSSLYGTSPDQEYAFLLEKEGKENTPDGLMYKNVVAGYFHVHFSGAEEWAHRFVDSCARYGGKI